MSGPEDARPATLAATLFGDVALDAWPPGDNPAGEPWDGFVRARKHLADGDQDLAIREWAAIETRAGFAPVESRHLLQAWHFLRSVNVHPDESIAAEVLGVVAEVAVGDSHDVLAVYADGSVRYLNHGGGSTIIDTAVPELTEPIAAVLAAGSALGTQIGPWTEPALPALPVGHTRFTLLTRGGPRFGQGPSEAIQTDPLAVPLFTAATALLVGIVDL
jgi:hypothetical protein